MPFMFEDFSSSISLSSREYMQFSLETNFRKVIFGLPFVLKLYPLDPRDGVSSGTFSG